MGKLEPDTGEIIKAKRNMKIAYLAQEFDVVPTRTVREEFYSVYDRQIEVSVITAECFLLQTHVSWEFCMYFDHCHREICNIADHELD